MDEQLERIIKSLNTFVESLDESINIFKNSTEKKARKEGIYLIDNIQNYFKKLRKKFEVFEFYNLIEKIDRFEKYIDKDIFENGNIDDIKEEGISIIDDFIKLSNKIIKFINKQFFDSNGNKQNSDNDEYIKIRETTVFNSKVKYIRPKYNNLKECLEDKNNIYIGRRGILVIDERRFPEENSPWANPYKVGKDGDLKEVLKKYKIYIKEKISNKEVNLNELFGKNLYCWCVEKPTKYNKNKNCVCHGEILLNLMNN